MRALRSLFAGLAALLLALAVIVPTIVYANATSIETGGTQYLPALVCTNTTANASAITVQSTTKICLNGSSCTVYLYYDGANTYVVGSNIIDVNAGIFGSSQTITQFTGWSNDAINLVGLNPDGATSVGAVIKSNSSYTTAGAKIASFRNASAEKAYVDKDGTVVTSSNGGYQSTNAAGQGLQFSGTNTSVKAGAALSTVFMSDQSTNFVDANATRILTDSAQGIRMTPKAMPTCSASIEWTMLPDSASGVATGKRSKMCMCTSDGASAYVWQNMVTGTLGTTTTCGTE